MWITVFFLVVLAAIVAVLYIYWRRKPYTVYQVNTHFNTSQMSDSLYPPFDQLFTIEDDVQKASLIFFTDYGEIDTYLPGLSVNPKALVYAILGSDLMANKAILARYMDKRYIPATYVLGEDDVSRLPDSIYFLKKNVQRQEGNLITRDVQYVRDKAYKDGYVVCQELLSDPFLVNKRKINMRVYLLITCFKSDLRMYIYDNGFMYYTPKFYEPDSTDKDVNVTTGYIDRKVYEENPLTHRDFYQWLGPEKSSRLRRNILELFADFKSKYKDKLSSLNSDGRFNIFGTDIAPDKNLNVKIMEVNKAPDLSFKDKRDGEVKFNMVKDMLTLVSVLNVGDPSHWILL